MKRIAWAALAAGALLAVLIPLRVSVEAPAEPVRAPVADARPEADAFRVIGWGQPNTVPHIEAMQREFRHVEVDLLLSAGGTLVGAHDLEKLALIESGRIARPLTLDHLLDLPYDSLFLDMKDTLPVDGVRTHGESHAADFVARAERAVSAAVEAVAAHRRSGEVFVMAYVVTEDMVSHARSLGVHLVLEGYPTDEASSLALVRRAAALEIDRVCIPLVRTTRAVLEESRRLGVAHVPYTFLDEPWEAQEYRWRIEEHLVGIILPPGAHHRRFIELLVD